LLRFVPFSIGSHRFVPGRTSSFDAINEKHRTTFSGSQIQERAIKPSRDKTKTHLDAYEFIKLIKEDV